MGANLVIVESPAKAKTINKILGKDFIVKASMGHVRDLPIKTLGVDVEHGFAPEYTNVKGRMNVIGDLKKYAQQADAIYLAPDPDREGEAIAWHLWELLKDKRGERIFHRVQYNEITPRAVREAFAHPGIINQSRVDAQQARRILDRLVGYKVSPLLWKWVKRGLSAGRVQSVALRLVCEREAEIRAFVPENFWLVGARVQKRIDPLTPFIIRLVRINDEKVSLHSESEVQTVLQDLESRMLTVQDVSVRSVHKRPPPPFITSSLQQAASTYCSFAPGRTMSIAQHLYEGIDLGDGPVGLITYMRTDSFALADDAVRSCRDYIKQTFGDPFLPEQSPVYRRKGLIQGAHEAIRPTDVTRTPESLKDHLPKPEWRVYELVWKRFVACQMESAVIDQRTVRIGAEPVPEGGRTYRFQATASTLQFAGYLKVAGTEIKPMKPESGGDAVEDAVPDLPPLTVGECLNRLEWLKESKQTQPPSRYSEASLIKALENNGVGRPSTFAQTLSTLVDREYVIKEKQSLAPTDLGIEVNRILVQHLGELFDVGFTAAMEAELDRIESGEVVWSDMLGVFYKRFSDWLGAIKVPTADAQATLGLIKALENVKAWRPESKRGKRTYSDGGFVLSIKEQMDAGKSVSPRQLQALARLVDRYRAQIPESDSCLQKAGMESVIEQRSTVPDESVTARFQLLQGLELREGTKKFVDSLQQQHEQGRSLSRAQLAALDRVLNDHAPRIPGFEAARESLGLAAQVTTEADPQTGELVTLAGTIQEWKPAVKRGKRVFDDRLFVQSLTDQFRTRGRLSERQVAALRKLLKRYKVEVPDSAATPQSIPVSVDPSGSESGETAP